MKAIVFLKHLGSVENKVLSTADSFYSLGCIKPALTKHALKKFMRCLVLQAGSGLVLQI